VSDPRSIVGAMAPDEDAAAGTPAQWHAPSPRLAVLRRYEVSGVTVLLLILAVVLALVLNAAGVAIVILAIAVTLVGAIADAVAQRRVRAWSYAERAEDLIVKRGVMFRRTAVIPYGRMQYVEVTAGPFERAFALATVQMHTAAAASDARIPGLPVAEAARLRDQLTSLGESHAMGL
jgi:membrane protein YdbS with pleckstrin-like domain